MVYVLGAAVVIGLGLYLYNLFLKGDIPALVKLLRWVIGGGALALALIFLLGGRLGPAGVLGAVGASILVRGRLGPIDFGGSVPSGGNQSSVRSRFLVMKLDHDTGEMWGNVVSGTLVGRKLIDLDEGETRVLLDEVAPDPDSLALLETWLDKYRAGWREYFEEKYSETRGEPGQGSGVGTEEEAYAVLGLEPGATPEEIRAAHRRLMKSVHPDQGGSTFLAAKINEAKELLLKRGK